MSGELEKFTAKLCLSKGLDPSDGNEELKRIMTERFLKNDFQMVSGVQKLVRHLGESGVPMAIATNMKADQFRGGMGRVVGFDFKNFSHYVCGGDDPEVEDNKPAPDVYLVCAKRFRPEPISLDRCVVFEDSIRGITGAIGSGMKTVLISDEKSSQFDAIRDQITVVVNSFDEFRPESVGLPPYPDPDQLKKLA